MVRIVVSGICGRTGRLVAVEAAGYPGTRLVGGLEALGHPCVGLALSDLCPEAAAGGVAEGAAVTDSLAGLDPGTFDVLVDFSSPEQAVACARLSAETGVPLVVATTGLTEEQASALETAAAHAAVVHASNTSVGANVLFALLESAASSLGEEFDIEIVEAHHRGKKDAPSGTALTAARVMADARGLDAEQAMRPGRMGRDAARSPGEIGLHSIRGGAVAGRHTVHFMSDLETLAVEHVALSRRAFAVGAIRAALFAADAEPGLYDMRDVLGIGERSRT